MVVIQSQIPDHPSDPIDADVPRLPWENGSVLHLSGVLGRKLKRYYGREKPVARAPGSDWRCSSA